MSQIQEIINSIVNDIEAATNPLIDKLAEAEEREREISEKSKKLMVKFSDEEIKLQNEETVFIFRKEDLSEEDREKELEQLRQKYATILSSRLTKLKEELAKEQELAQKLQKEISEDLDKTQKNIPSYIAKTYTGKVIEALEIAKREGADPNPIYQGEGQFKGYAISHFVAHGLFKEEGIKILSCLSKENIKRGSGFESGEFERESHKESELMIAIKEQNADIINWFLENDEEVNWQKESGSTALHMSCLVKAYNTTKRLLEKGANPNVINKYGCTPLLDLIIKAGDLCSVNEELMLDFLKLFKEYGADFNLKNQSGFSIFELYICSNILSDIIRIGGVKINNVKAVLEMLALDQNVEIDLSKKYINKFFTNTDNLEQLFAQEFGIKPKITVLCKLQKALVKFATENNYPKEKALDYFKENVRMGEDGIVTQEAEDAEEYESFTSDKLQTVIAKKLVDAAQMLYDKLRSIVKDAAEYPELDTLQTMVNELINPVEIALEETDQAVGELDPIDAGVDLAGVTLNTDKDSDDA